MGIRLDYTPYGAVGGLAEHAGQAQQAIREQQYTEQEAEQARSIAAQKEMQATQIGASREEWQQKLTTQQEQFAMNQAAQQEQAFRNQQASEFATMKSAQVQQAQIAAQQEQFEQDLALRQQQMLADQAAKEQSFELEQAQEARLYKSALGTIQSKQVSNMLDLTKLQSDRQQQENDLAIQSKYIQQINASDMSVNDKLRNIYAVQQGATTLPGLTKPGQAPVERAYSVIDIGRLQGMASDRFAELYDPWGSAGPSKEDTRASIRDTWTTVNPINDAQMSNLAGAITQAARKEGNLDMTTVSDELAALRKETAAEGSKVFTSMDANIRVAKKAGVMPSMPSWGIGPGAGGF